MGTKLSGFCLGAAVGAAVGFAASSMAAGGLMFGISFGQWQRLAPPSQLAYVVGMEDAMSWYRPMHPTHAYRELVRAEDCIRGKSLSPEQLAQGMAEYGKLNPSIATVAGLAVPVSGALGSYFEFICPELFNQAAYDRDDNVAAKYRIDPKDYR
jgi:hypothetical protein